ncbi:MAG TPA: hypothetical protein VID73_10065 [Ktedonobacterales bacterium]|jgi:hypothetical protein
MPIALARTRGGLPRAVALVALAALVAGCARAAATAGDSGRAPAPGAPCMATDQDRYVWDPTRLQLVRPCVYVTGTIATAVDLNSDGDRTFLVRLDARYQNLLQPSNVEGGVRGLDVEAVCNVPSVIPAVLALCSGDAHPYLGAVPPVGTHVWLEGRYIFDLHHESHAELHPLYRMGTLAP